MLKDLLYLISVWTNNFDGAKEKLDWQIKIYHSE